MRFLQPLKVGNPVSKLWFMLWDHAQDRFKRMCLLSSLHAQLLHVNEDDRDQLLEVNREMDLDRDVRALRFPTLLAPMIWPHVITIDKIDMQRQDFYINKVMKAIPCWLRYGDEEAIKDDIRHLLRFCEKRGCLPSRA